MTFSIRDVLWAMVCFALIASWLVTSRRQASHVQLLQQRLQEVEDQSQMHEQAAKYERLTAEQIADRAARKHRNQHREILGLRQLLKRSIDDQRDWFELEVDRNRIVAIAPATPNAGAVTARTVKHAEKATGLDGSRLRHFLTPIHQLRLQQK